MSKFFRKRLKKIKKFWKKWPKSKNIISLIRNIFRKHNAAFWKLKSNVSLHVKTYYSSLHQTFRLFIKALCLSTIGILITQLLDVSKLNSGFLSPSQGYFDVDITDYFVSYCHRTIKAKPPKGREFLLLDIALLNRVEIAGILEKIAPYKPRVTGIDVYFENRGDPATNAILLTALKSQQQIVVGQRLSPDGNAISLDAAFDTLGSKGVINFIAHDSVSVVRFIPSGLLGKRPSFSALVAQKYAPSTYLAFSARENPTERIFYDPEICFEKRTAGQILSMQDSSELAYLLTDKIVLMGDMGLRKGTRTLEDLHFTPANEVYVGKSFPDKSGLEIHANALSMILRKTYFYEIPDGFNFLIALLAVYAGIWAELNIKPKIGRLIFALVVISFPFILGFIYFILFYHFRIAFNSSDIIAICGSAWLTLSIYDTLQEDKMIRKQNETSK